MKRKSWHHEHVFGWNTRKETRLGRRRSALGSKRAFRAHWSNHVEWGVSSGDSKYAIKW